jgi:hypothetical protein
MMHGLVHTANYDEKNAKEALSSHGELFQLASSSASSSRLIGVINLIPRALRLNML